jgi:putative membrane protein
MKTNTLQIFLIMLLSIALISCNNQGARDADNDNDSIQLNGGDDGLFGDDQSQDVEFMKEAAYGGLMEVELGQYAQQNAQDTRVRNFGAMMVRDHTTANEELKALASRKNVTLPTTLDDEHLDKVNNLKENRGLEFDKEYMSEMVNEHEKEVDKYMKQAEQGNDADVKAFAANTLTVLLIHQDSAKNINDYIKNREDNR